MARRPKSLYGPNAYKRTVRDTTEERDLCYGRLRDYGKGKSVQIFWDLSEEAKEDRIFKLKVDNMELYLDAEQCMKFLRWV